MSLDLSVWLTGEGASAPDAGRVLESLADRLVAAGMPVHRMTTGIAILHPQISSYGHVWEAGKPLRERDWMLTAETMGMFRNSPIYHAYQGEGPIRCRPQEPATPGEYGILPDLRAEGVTDYIVYPMPFTDGSFKALTLATRDRTGFREEHLRDLAEGMALIALAFEIKTLRRTAGILLDTYVGPIAGGRVLDGEIRRGMGEAIRAVIWFSDLRGFTALSESLPRDAVIALLNDYLGAVGAAVEAEGGEILKFIGDAVLAIFPYGGDPAGGRAACQRAVAAARRTAAAIGAINARRQEKDDPEIRYGVALHPGDVQYGNVGAERRLDFTVIGPAVNLASRIEGLCGILGETVLVSAAFRDLSGIACRALGDFDLKGIAEPRTVLVPLDGD